MRHAVLGAGGVGGLVGGMLAKAGHPVTLLVRPGRGEQYPDRVSVQSEALGSFEAPVRVAERLEGEFDVVWITVKATALEAALEAVPPERLGGAVADPLQAPATPELSLVAGAGQRFESARRLFVFPANTAKTESHRCSCRGLCQQYVSSRL
jgi:Ketopantoate reductase PanE/ApbA